MVGNRRLEDCTRIFEDRAIDEIRTLASIIRPVPCEVDSSRIFRHICRYFCDPHLVERGNPHGAFAVRDCLFTMLKKH